MNKSASVEALPKRKIMTGCPQELVDKILETEICSGKRGQQSYPQHNKESSIELKTSCLAEEFEIVNQSKRI